MQWLLKESLSNIDLYEISSVYNLNCKCSQLLPMPPSPVLHKRIQMQHQHFVNRCSPYLWRYGPCQTVATEVYFCKRVELEKQVGGQRALCMCGSVERAGWRGCLGTGGQWVQQFVSSTSGSFTVQRDARRAHETPALLRDGIRKQVQVRRKGTPSFASTLLYLQASTSIASTK